MSETVPCPGCGAANVTEARFCSQCGGPIDAANGATSSLAPGTVLGGDFEIVRPLGVGGMGTVYEAVQVSLDRPVALKLLHRELLSHPTAAERFHREGKSMASIDHPNVVRIHTRFEHEGTVVLVLQLVKGGDLTHRIRSGMDWAQSRQMMLGVLRGLEALDARDLVHRDIKPDNILLEDTTGTPKITDLGIAHDSADQRGVTRVGARLGTAEYMSPEQIRGVEIDRRTDLYASGIILFEMLTGVVPFTGETDFDIWQAHSLRDVPVERVHGKAPAEVISWIERALAKDPDARWSTATEALAALEAVPADAELTAPPAAETEPTPSGVAPSEPPEKSPGSATSEASPDVVDEPDEPAAANEPTEPADLVASDPESASLESSEEAASPSVDRQEAPSEADSAPPEEIPVRSMTTGPDSDPAPPTEPAPPALPSLDRSRVAVVAGLSACVIAALLVHLTQDTAPSPERPVKERAGAGMPTDAETKAAEAEAKAKAAEAEAKAKAAEAKAAEAEAKAKAAEAEARVKTAEAEAAAQRDAERMAAARRDAEQRAAAQRAASATHVVCGTNKPQYKEPWLELRSGPNSKQYPSQGRMYDGTKLKWLGNKQGKWLKVRVVGGGSYLNGSTGWAHSKWVCRR